MPRSTKSPLDKARASEIDWPKVAPLFDAARTVANPSFVYLIGEQDDGPVKIGVAKDPITRLRAMQTGNSRRLRLERVLVGDRNIEQLLHQIWRHLAIVSPTKAGKPDSVPGTEWFEAEIRVELFPVVDTLTAAQIDHIADNIVGDRKDLDIADFERIVREAHGAHDVVAHRPHEVRLLAAGGGYVSPRRIRI